MPDTGHDRLMRTPAAVLVVAAISLLSLATVAASGGPPVFRPSQAPLHFSTFLGGNGSTLVLGAAWGDDGSAYVTGRTTARAFPATPGGFAETFPDGASGAAFVAKFDADGQLVYATFLGGANETVATSIDVDPAGNAYVAGHTSSSDFPTTPGASNRTLETPLAIFVAKLNPVGSGLVYATFVGGGGDHESVAVDGQGRAHVASSTLDPNFPTTQGASDTTFNGGIDAVLARLNPGGTDLEYATYHGGSGADAAYGLAIDSDGSAYVTGQAGPDLPTTPGAFDTSWNGGYDAFVATFNVSGELVYSTFLGGGGSEWGLAVAADADGNAYVTGPTDSTDFPTTPLAFDWQHRGGATDGFVAKLDPSGAALAYSTYFGGSGAENAVDIDVDASGNAVLAGWTTSADFPATNGAYRTSLAGGSDAFVLELNAAGDAVLYSTFLGGVTCAPGALVCGSDIAFSVDAGPAGGTLVGGATDSADFPTTAGAFDGTVNGNAENGFVTSLTLTGATPIGRRGEFPWLYVVVPVAVAVAGILAFVLWRRRRRPASPPAPPAA